MPFVGPGIELEPENCKAAALFNIQPMIISIDYIFLPFVDLLYYINKSK